MPTLFLLCGLPSSGKTTLAKQLESDHAALTLNLDAWTVPLFGHHMAREVFDAQLAQLKTLQWTLAERLLRLGVNVVLDWGFWTRTERTETRRRGEQTGAEVHLVYLKVSVNELWRRLELRGHNLPPGTFQLDRAALDLFARQFQPPGPEEPHEQG